MKNLFPFESKTDLALFFCASVAKVTGLILLFAAGCAAGLWFFYLSALA